MPDHIEALITHHQKTLIIKSDNAEIYNKLAMLYRLKGDFREAIQCYVQAIQISANCFHSYWGIKYSLISMNWLHKTVDSKLLDEGIDTLKSAIKTQSKFPFAHVLLGDLLTQKGNIKESINYYKTASYTQLSLAQPELVNKKQLVEQKQPDFLILGFMRSGTTSLYQYLTLHPKILPAVDKEIHFFTSFFEAGVDWYLAHFPTILNKNDYLTGEATPIYVCHPGIADKVFKLFPEMKLIVLLRNPVKRAISSIFLQSAPNSRTLLSQLISNALTKAKLMMDSTSDIFSLQPLLNQSFSCDFIETTLIYHLLSSLYVFYIKEWLSVFPGKQLLIIKSEDFFRNTEEKMAEVYQFLNLPNHKIFDYKTHGAGVSPFIPDDLNHDLTEFYRPYNQQLEEYLSMKFNWE